jgi:hypothetical protein
LNLRSPGYDPGENSASLSPITGPWLPYLSPGRSGVTGWSATLFDCGCTIVQGWLAPVKRVPEEGVEPSLAGSKPAVLPVDHSGEAGPGRHRRNPDSRALPDPWVLGETSGRLGDEADSLQFTLHARIVALAVAYRGLLVQVGLAHCDCGPGATGKDGLTALLIGA